MKVSVHIITYNHEEYIAQALDSVLMQKVDFDYEIVIGEDCSTDNTRQIVVDYQQKYPDKIRALLHETNIGGTQNDIAVHNACQGEYIAWLEGDDYWTSPHKLQKQVNYLDQHRECSMCFHSTRHFHENGSRPDYNSKPPIAKEFFELEDLFYGSFMPTCSVMVRRVHIAKLPDWYEQTYAGDWGLQILITKYGKIGYIDEVMGATRIHDRGVWNGLSKIQQFKNMINDYKIMRENLAEMNTPEIANQISCFYHYWACKAACEGNTRDARISIIKSISESPFNPRISNVDRIKLFIKVYTPGLNTLINQLRTCLDA